MACSSCLYSFNKFNNSVSQNNSFNPTNNNWLISANNGKSSYYFPNLSSYNNWASTCCGQSANAIYSGNFNGYTIQRNF